VAGRPSYPFVPKSTAYLEAGQFWAIPLSDGRFACGRVLAVPREPDPHILVGNRAFLAGLHDWVSDRVPDAEAIAGVGYVAQGFCHIKAITTTGGEVLGLRDPAADPLELRTWRSHISGGTVWIYQGATRLRPATPADAGLPVIAVWGYSVIRDYAERQFVGQPWTA
jgi:hypothetical protein